MRRGVPVERRMREIFVFSLCSLCVGPSCFSLSLHWDIPMSERERERQAGRQTDRQAGRQTEVRSILAVASVLVMEQRKACIFRVGSLALIRRLVELFQLLCGSGALSAPHAHTCGGGVGVRGCKRVDSCK